MGKQEDFVIMQERLRRSVEQLGTSVQVFHDTNIVSAQESAQQMLEKLGPAFQTIQDSNIASAQENARQMLEQLGPAFQTIQDSNIASVQESARQMLEQLGPTFQTIQDSNIAAIHASARRMAEQLAPAFQTIQDSSIISIQESARRAIEQIGHSVQVFQDTNFLAMQESVLRMMEQMEEYDLITFENLEENPNIIFGEVLDDSNNEEHTLAMNLKETVHSIEIFFGFTEGQLINEFRSWALNKVFDGIYNIFISIITVSISMFMIVSSINNEEFANYPQQEKVYLKQRVHEIKQKVEKTGNNNIRLVTKDIPIYFSDRRNSTKVGELYVGDEVIILKKNKNWSKIKWVEEGNTDSIVGWVYTRYLKKIN